MERKQRKRNLKSVERNTRSCVNPRKKNGKGKKRKKQKK